MKILIGLLLYAMPAVVTQGQEIAVRGRVTDRTTGMPLQDATVSVSRGNFTRIGQTDSAGSFMLTLPVGRFRVAVSYTGYFPAVDELLVTAGKEPMINIAMEQASWQLEAVEVTASSVLPDPYGVRSMTIEKALRIPANFFDPVRAATSYPGVVTANDQNNSIIVRGNSPNGLLWRLNGLDIVNPNHLANAGTLSDRPAANGGGVNILSAQMLDRTDFYAGSLPPRYGNALSGVIDMQLREGNKNRYEYTAQASLIGLDVSAEGPIGKNRKTSFLTNYRYSTVGLLSAAGIDFGGEAITFQDISVTLNSQFENRGELSFFGFWGGSKNDFDAREPGEWEEDKDRYSIQYKGDTYAAGVNYQAPLANGKLFAGLVLSALRHRRDANVSPEMPAFDRHLLSDRSRLENDLLSSMIRYDRTLGKRTKWEIGITTNYLTSGFASSEDVGCLSCSARETRATAYTGEGALLQPFTNVDVSFSSWLSLTAGVRYLQYTFNDSHSFQPRFSTTIKPSKSADITLAYGLTTQLQSPQVYAVNRRLKPTGSHQADVIFTQALPGDFRLRAGIFYQRLADVPVEDNLNSTFSALNLLEGMPPPNLVNRGTGQNHGADMTLEKSFYNKDYVLVSGSYYESAYTGGDGVKRNTRFDGRYTFSATYGKEWATAERNRTIGLSTRVLCLGGLRQSPVDIGASQHQGETVYDHSDPFREKMSDYFRVDLRLSFRKDKVRYTRTLALDVQNVTSRENDAYRYYDFTQQKVVTKLQLGIIPVLLYRIDF